MDWEMHPTLKLIGEFVELGADAVTLVIGVTAIVGLITQRKKLALIVRLYLNNHFNQRARKAQENISKLHELDYNNKEQKAEIVRLLHALRGQLRPWLDQRASLAEVYGRLDSIVEKRVKLSQPIKSEIAHELEEVLENIFLNDVVGTANSGVTSEQKGP